MVQEAGSLSDIMELMEIRAQSEDRRPWLKQGHLEKWKGRFTLSSNAWKIKYVVLGKDHKMKMFANKDDLGVRGASFRQIDLRLFRSCIETRHVPGIVINEATNSFTLIPDKDGIFDPSPVVFSCETLTEMHEWIRAIGRSLRECKAEKIKKSPDIVRIVKRRQSEEESNFGLRSGLSSKDLRRSFDEGSLAAQQGPSNEGRNKRLDLTYSYSSSEDDDAYLDLSLNADHAFRESHMKRRSRFRESKKGDYNGGQPVSTAGSLFEASSSSRSQTHTDSIGLLMTDVESQFARIQPKPQGAFAVDQDDVSMELESMDEGDNRNQQVNEAVSAATEMLRNLQSQSKQLEEYLRTLDADVTRSRRDLGNVQDNLASVQMHETSLDDRLSRMTMNIKIMEKQGTATLKSIQDMQKQTSQALREAEAAKNEYIALRDQAQQLLRNIQDSPLPAAFHSDDPKRRSLAEDLKRRSLAEPTTVAEQPYYSRTFPKPQRSLVASRKSNLPSPAKSDVYSRPSVQICQDPLHLQERMGHF